LLGVAGGDLRIGQLKLQTGNPCRILASLLRRQVDELLDRDRCFLGSAKSCKPNDDIDDPSRDALLFVALISTIVTSFVRFNSGSTTATILRASVILFQAIRMRSRRRAFRAGPTALAGCLSQSLVFSRSSRLLSRRNRKIAVGKTGDTVIPAYRESKDVGPDSTTETYVALKRQIDNWRWAGVPFYLRTGKALSIKRTEVAIKFREAPFAMFERTPVEQLAENYLVIGIEPTEGVMLQFNTKCPVPRSELAACK
jgi:hypothetical protein